MNVNIFSYSDKGCVLALEISKIFPNSQCFAIAKFAEKYNINKVTSTSEKVREVFDSSDLLIFVGACGIAVRAIAPVVKSKTSDPACVVIDDCANFVIPILSGHIGGANEYCEFLAEKTAAVPVITTATDINKKFSVDTFARKNGLYITDMKKAMQISAEILNNDIAVAMGENVIMNVDFPNSVYASHEGEFGVYVGYEKFSPYQTTLNLVPKILHVGIGCKKNTPKENIEKLFNLTLEEENIDIHAIKSIASIDIKSEEQGLLAFAKEYSLTISFYSAEKLMSIKGDFTKSDFVKSITGVDNVCERSAVANSGTGKIIVRKRSLNGVTIAIASEIKEVNFG